MQQSDAALRLLGLAMRAGAVAYGTQLVRDAVRSGSVHFVVIAGDASENSREKLLPLLQARGVAHAVAFDRDRLGAALGRGPLSAVGIRTVSFAERIRAEMGVGEKQV